MEGAVDTLDVVEHFVAAHAPFGGSEEYGRKLFPLLAETFQVGIHVRPEAVAFQLVRLGEDEGERYSVLT